MQGKGLYLSRKKGFLICLSATKCFADISALNDNYPSIHVTDTIGGGSQKWF